MLPLLHDMPKSGDTPSSSAKSVMSGPRESDETMRQLRTYVTGRKASLHGFDVDTPDPVIREMYSLLKSSVTNFLTNWFGMKIVPPGSRTNLIIANEASPATITKLVKQASTQHRNNPTVLVLCSQNARINRDSISSAPKNKVGYVAKPVGPLKLAKAIMQCLDGAPPMITPGVEQPHVTSPTQSNDLTNVFEELSFTHNNELLDNSRMAVDTENARKAIESPTPTHQDKHAEFPFPSSSPEHRPKATSAPASNLDLSNIINRRTSFHEPASQTLTALERKPPSPILQKSLLSSLKTTTTTASSSTERKYAPTMLLVDDNKINLRLLKTYMLKKKYPVIDEAENGLEAVNKFSAREGGYDIIFMDISMPILDGFGATKQIRAIERSRRRRSSIAPAASTLPSAFMTSQQESVVEDENVRRGSAGSSGEVGGNGGNSAGKGAKGDSLIIALTGLASGSDQQEAANVGIDIFLTKPVSFKEVGRLLENWEANREREVGGGGS
jgi:CheY-like chemotaxis protein